MAYLVRNMFLPNEDDLGPATLIVSKGKSLIDLSSKFFNMLTGFTLEMNEIEEVPSTTPTVY